MYTVIKSQDADKGKPKAALLQSVAGLLDMLDQLSNRAPSIEGMGMYYGVSGAGKSSAAAVAVGMMDAVYVEVQSTWTQRTFWTALARELSVTVIQRTDVMSEEIAHALIISGRPVLIDEADVMIKKDFIEAARSVYMQSKSPVILIGEDALESKIKRHERIDNRIHIRTKVPLANNADAQALAEFYSPEVTIADDLIAKIVDVSGRRVRRIVSNIEHARQFALENGDSSIDLAGWGDRVFQSQHLGRGR